MEGAYDMSATRILIADDDQEILTITSRSLQSQGYLTFECRNGIDAYQAIVSQPFDLILLDINMEGLDGFRIIQKVREQQIFTPILIITGNAEEYNEVFGLSIGADDYIIKPFRPSALCARVKALLRRQQQFQKDNATLKAGPFQMDRESYSFYKNNVEPVLTPKERLLMQHFLHNVNHVFSKEQLYTAVWKDNCVDDNTVMVTIRNLRQKIEDDPKSPKYLLTVYGIGYKFVITQ